MDTLEYICTQIQESIDVKYRILQDVHFSEAISKMGDMVADTIASGGKLLICGNGGSASDALHIAGEIVGRFQKERKAYCAIALNSDVATMTAIANDYGYDQVFSRQIEGLMQKGDVLLGISTSGNSANMIKAFEKAKELNGHTLLLSGKDGGKLVELADCAIVIPSEVTAHIQEAHTVIYHIICGLVEERLNGGK